MMTRPRPVWSSIWTLRPRARCNRLGVLFGSLFGVQEALDVGFGLANGKRKTDYVLGDLFHLFRVFEDHKGASVTEAEFAGFDEGLHGGRETQEAEEIGHRGAILAGALGHLLLGHVELAGEALEGAGLLHGVEVGSLEVFDDGDFHRLLVGNLSEDGGDGGHAGKLGGQPAAFADNELEATAGQRPHQHGLDHAVGNDRGGQLSQLLLVHVGTGLEGIAIDLIEGNLAGLAAFCIGGGNGSGNWHTRKKRIQAFAKGAAFGVDRSDGHG